MICENTRQQAEQQLELWRKAIENKGLRVSWSNIEYLPPSFCHNNEVKVAGEEIENETTLECRCLMQEVDAFHIAKTETD